MNIENIININTEKLKKQMNTNTFDTIYNTARNIMFDNIILIIVLFVVIKYYAYSEETFNYWIILIIFLILLSYYSIKILLRRYLKLEGIMRTNDCMEAANHIIFNNTIKPIETNKYLLDRPLNEFFINTSHNTYIPCNQNIDISSTEAIKRVLLMGARCIELDCYAKNNTGTSNEDLEPVVTHAIQRDSGDIFTNSYITFEDCIDTIATYGFLTSDPLIVYLEQHVYMHEYTTNRMRDIIFAKLKDKLLQPSYINFHDMPIKNLLNKVIFITNNAVTFGLNDFISSNRILMKEHTNSILDKPVTYFTRVWPDASFMGNFSYNYDPVKFWENKCNMVSLNFQVLDDNMMKNIAFFKNSSFVHFSEVNLMKLPTITSTPTRPALLLNKN